MTLNSEAETDSQIVLFDDDPIIFLRLMTPDITPGVNDEYIDDFIYLSEVMMDEGVEAYADACADTFAGGDIDEMIQYGIENVEIVEAIDSYTGQVFINPDYE